ncbi:SirB2 family protein [Noviherbaspirillum sp.]|uniref:SirB2 family protein n=1 Tax=Noviherbaspirillum sp. TaxID=1926288 RepID=UPI002B476E9B|nr:SirB2 family protein [Noviherbaspirillum sp.]HJV82963.1 SirB2 family protein [Noviherbaspirillum sp.]
MSYLAIKYLHMTCAALSGLLFLARGMLMLADSPLLNRRPLKILPHVIDTVLLASALTMVVWSGQYPFVQNWLTAKVIALIAYILVGSVAIKRGKTKGIRTVAFVIALMLFGYIVKVALTRQVWW